MKKTQVFRGILLFLICGSSFGATDFKNFRQPLDQLFLDKVPLLKLASELEPLSFGLGRAITFEECEKIKRQISLAEGFSPFEPSFTVTLDEPAMTYHSKWCEDPSRKVSVLEGSPKAYFGQVAEKALVEISQEVPGRSSKRVLLLNTENKIIAENDIIVSDDGSIRSFRVAAKNLLGDSFRNVQNEDNDGVYSRQVWVDGTGTRITVFSRPKPKNYPKPLLKWFVRVPTAQDWDSLRTSLLFLDFSSFFFYGQKVFGTPKNVDELEVILSDGHEVCAEGSRMKGEVKEIFTDTPFLSCNSI